MSSDAIVAAGLPGLSTLIMSAPRSPSIIVQKGPASTLEKNKVCFFKDEKQTKKLFLHY